MPNGYTYEIRLRDMMTAGFAKAAQASSSFYRRLVSDGDKAKANIDRIPKSVNNMESSFSSLKSTLSGVIGIAGGVGLILATFGAAKGVAKLGADLEQTRISFNTMLGSAERGNSMLKQLDTLANVTPFSNDDLQQSAKVLLNFGITGDKIIPTLQRIGDVSGGNAEKLNGLTLAFAQVSSAGKLQGQDLMQMINQGFNPLQEISRTTGKSMGYLRDQMEKGHITAKMVEGAFASATGAGGMFNGMMDKQSQTLGGKWSTLVGTFQSKVAVFAEKYINPFLSKIVDVGIAVVENFGLIPGYIRDNLDVIIPLGVAVAALSAQYVIATAVSKTQALWTGILTAKQWLLNAALTANPIGLVIAGIALLVAGFALAYKKVDWFRGAIQGAWEGLKTFAVGIKDHVVDSFQKMLSGLTGIAKALKYLFTGDFKKAMEVGKDAGKDLFGGVVGVTPVGMISSVVNNSKKIGNAAQKGYARGLAEAASKKTAASTSSNEATASGTEAPLASPLAGAESTVEGIATGGKKTTILNVKIENVLGTVNQTVTNGKESADELVDAVLDGLTRRLHGTFSGVGQ